MLCVFQKTRKGKQRAVRVVLGEGTWRIATDVKAAVFNSGNGILSDAPVREDVDNDFSLCSRLDVFGPRDAWSFPFLPGPCQRKEKRTQIRRI